MTGVIHSKWNALQINEFGHFTVYTTIKYYFCSFKLTTFLYVKETIETKAALCLGHIFSIYYKRCTFCPAPNSKPAWKAWGCGSCLPLDTFGYLWLPLVSFPYLSSLFLSCGYLWLCFLALRFLNFLTFPYLSLHFFTFPYLSLPLPGLTGPHFAFGHWLTIWLTNWCKSFTLHVALQTLQLLVSVSYCCSPME